MKNNDLGEKDARISGICFLIYAALMFVLAFYTFYSFLSSLHSTNDEYGGGWFIFFNIIFLLLAIAFSFLALGIMCFAFLYLVTGIFILQKKPLLGIAIVSFLLAAGQLFLWIIYPPQEYALYATNPVTVAGTAFFGIMALILGVPKFSSKKWFVRKFWLLPPILLVASVFVSPLQYLFLKLIGNNPYPMDTNRYLITILRLILLFPAYFFACRWMKKTAGADLYINGEAAQTRGQADQIGGQADLTGITQENPPENPDRTNSSE